MEHISEGELWALFGGLPAIEKLLFSYLWIWIICLVREFIRPDRSGHPGPLGSHPSTGDGGAVSLCS